MPRRDYVNDAFTVAILATIGGVFDLLSFKITPPILVALWFPPVVLTGVSGFALLALALVQFPLFATAFAIGIRRWSPGRVLTAIVITYAVLTGLALAKLYRAGDLF